MKEVHLLIRVWAPVDMPESKVCDIVQDTLDNDNAFFSGYGLKDPEVYLDEDNES